MKKILFPAVIALCLAASCSQPKKPVLTESGLDPAKFDTTINNIPIKLYVLKNGAMEACITNYGGRLVSLMVPDRNGKPTDVVLGYDNVRQYADREHSPSDYGASIGRYANRIYHGKITVDGKEIQLPINDNGHCLHGGPTGWQYQPYEASQPNDSTLVLTMHSPDGDNNFPGNVTAVVTYKAQKNNVLDITFEATTDKRTVINMTNHAYFNLNGDFSKPAENMLLYVNADKYTPSDSSYMTTGEILPVEGTPMDFRKPRVLSETINDTTFTQIRNASGYDHNWCLSTGGDVTKVAASLESPVTGIHLDVYTNEPGIQVYTGNFQGTGIPGKHGVLYPKHVSVCLESQKYPDSPNKEQFASPFLDPGQKYLSRQIFAFSVKK